LDVAEVIRILIRERDAGQHARVDDDRAVVGQIDALGQAREVLVVLFTDQRARARVIRKQRTFGAAPLLQMFLFVIAEDALVLHGQLDAFPRGGTAVDEIACEDDPVARGGTHELEKVESLLEAPVQITDDDRATHGPEATRLPQRI
jgi:hypothetical protein